MSTSKPIFIPHIIHWLLRITCDEELCSGLMEDAVAFSGWYSPICDIFPWPKEVEAIQEQERARKLSLDRMVKLLSQIDYVFNGSASAAYAKRLLEGYAVFNWLNENDGINTLRNSAVELRNSLLSPERMIELEAQTSSTTARLIELGDILNLSRLEKDILAFAFLSSASEELSGFFRKLSADRFLAQRLWPVVFDTNKEELSKAMRVDSPLRLSGLLQSAGVKNQLVHLSRFWVDLLADSENLFEAIVELMDKPPGSGMPARLLQEDQDLACSILRNADEPGVNLLLYGAPSLEKRRLVRDIAAQCGKRPWRVRLLDEASRYDKPALTYIAFKMLARHEPDALLVIERPSEVLDTGKSDLIRAFFGIELETEGMPEFDEHLLTTNPIPGLWLASGVGSLPDETCARFVFHAPVKKADKATRLAALEELVSELNLSDESRDSILSLEGVSSAQVQAATRAAKLSGKLESKDRDAAIVQAIKRSQRALNRDLQPKAKECVTKYSLKYVNATGRFGPAQVLEAFRRNPKGNLLLYGIPGTGKTQFAEYIASELGLPLICRSASDLLSKWLGESEKNIAKAFEDAANEDGILFLDEGDSFLRSRQEAHNSWEITQVNELLQHMERFPGIVIVATNLFRGLDPASIRRFTFKLEFKELDVDQRWEMFVNEAELAEQLISLPEDVREDWNVRLTLMHHLTAGDFATVKRQSLILGVKLTPEEWLSQLELESKLKNIENARGQVV